MARQLETSVTVKFGPGLHAAQNEHALFPLSRYLQSGLGRRPGTTVVTWEAYSLTRRQGSKGLILLGQSKTVSVSILRTQGQDRSPGRTKIFQPSISASFPIIFIICPLAPSCRNHGAKFEIAIPVTYGRLNEAFTKTRRAGWTARHGTGEGREYPPFRLGERVETGIHPG